MKIEDFAKIYDRTYDILYDGEVPCCSAAIAFDRAVKEDKKFKNLVQKFCEYRHDFISSDREAAAFFIAYGGVM